MNLIALNLIALNANRNRAYRNHTWWWRGYMPGTPEENPDVFVSPFPGWMPLLDGSWGGYARVVGPFGSRSEANRASACWPLTGECASTLSAASPFCALGGGPRCGSVQS